MEEKIREIEEWLRHARCWDNEAFSKIDYLLDKE